MQMTPGERETTTPGRPAVFAVPAPVQRLFSAFPLVTYPAERLPSRRPGDRDEDLLFVFSSEADAAAARPSFNPACLKWQVSGRAGGRARTRTGCTDAGRRPI